VHCGEPPSAAWDYAVRNREGQPIQTISKQPDACHGCTKFDPDYQKWPDFPAFAGSTNSVEAF
jgi:hypothetical protein